MAHHYLEEGEAMGANMHLEGVKTFGDKEKAMKRIYDTCKEYGIDMPDEVRCFFKDEDGFTTPLEQHGCCTKLNEEYRDGFEVDVAKIPLSIKTIRFFISY